MNKSKLVLLVLCASLSTFMYSMTTHEQFINEQLIEAARNGNIQQAQEALSAGANINTKYHGLTPLDCAISCRDVAMVRFLLNSDAHVNTQDRDGATVLHWNVTTNNSIAEEITRLLLASGADVNAQNKLGCTPLHYAVNAKNTNQIKLLLKAGAHSDAQANTGWTSLHYLSRDGNADIAKLLIENGARLQLKNHHNLTTLDLAKKHNKQDMVKLLTELVSLKDLAARVVRKQINQGTLTLEQVKNSVPQELYELVIEYL
jgi:ankyrin repeat protein